MATAPSARERARCKAKNILIKTGSCYRNKHHQLTFFCGFSATSTKAIATEQSTPTANEGMNSRFAAGTRDVHARSHKTTKDFCLRRVHWLFSWNTTYFSEPGGILGSWLSSSCVMRSHELRNGSASPYTAYTCFQLPRETVGAEWASRITWQGLPGHSRNLDSSGVSRNGSHVHHHCHSMMRYS